MRAANPRASTGGEGCTTGVSGSAEAGFDTQPSDSDIAGTRRNMLEKVLKAEKYPFVFIRVRGVETARKGVTLPVAITLHGITRTPQAPAQVETEADRMSVTGTWRSIRLISVSRPSRF